MNLQEINAAALSLYCDPGLLPILIDALADLSLSWPMWLEQSGTLERLAECMVIFSDGTAAHEYQLAMSGHGVGAWLRALKWAMTDEPQLRHLHYARICAVFGVPAVQVEVGTGAPDREPWDKWWLTWSAPSVPLALAVLRETMGANEFRTEDPVAIQRAPSNFVWLASAPGNVIQITGLHEAVRQHAPQATRYRICLGAGEWVERA